MISRQQFFKYHFSLKLTLRAIFLAVAMLIAAKWQWTRYHEKLVLVEEYKNHDKSKPFEVDVISSTAIDFKDFVNRKIVIKGHFDFQNQVLITNRRHKFGTGHWLITPFKPLNSEQKILVSRGFIPYEDRDESSWNKYSKEVTELIGVVQQSVGKRSFFSPSAKTPFPKLYLYPDLALISEDIRDNINIDHYIQSIAEPVYDKFPATDISIDVPPSTHFWYTFEWIGLSFMTLLVAFLIQLFKPKRPCA